jgi:translation initiation factor eIF-2B subunit delta
VVQVFVGAAAMMNNGGLLSRVGTAMIALMAKAHSTCSFVLQTFSVNTNSSCADVPFLVCCETYKFCERVQLDSICLNELGNPEELRVVPGVAEEVSGTSTFTLPLTLFISVS